MNETEPSENARSFLVRARDLARGAFAAAARHQLPFAVLTVALATTLFFPFRGELDKAHWGVGYLGLVVAVAAIGGSRAASVSAIVAFACWNYFFIPPYYTFAVSEKQDWLSLLIFLVVSTAVGLLTGQSRERERRAIGREREATLLNRLSGEILATESERQMAETALETVRGTITADEMGLFIRQGDGRLVVTWSPQPAEWRSEVRASAEALLSPSAAPVSPADAPSSASTDRVFLPLQTKEGVLGVLYAGRTNGIAFEAEDHRLLASVANLLSAFLQQARLRRQASQASALREADQLKSTFIASVSHELKTPLASLMASVTGLLADGTQGDERLRTELEAAVVDLRRLESSIGDLLDIARLEGDAWRFQPELYEIGEVIGNVLAELPDDARRRIALAVSPDLPPVMLDLRQMARALRNVVDNALRYSPQPTPVTIGARILGDGLIVWVQDSGPGVAAEETSRVFDKFYIGEGARSSPGSTGLGLAIAKEIVLRHGGHIWVEPAEPRGACFSLSVPLRSNSTNRSAS